MPNERDMVRSMMDLVYKTGEMIVKPATLEPYEIILPESYRKKVEEEKKKKEYWEYEWNGGLPYWGEPIPNPFPTPKPDEWYSMNEIANLKEALRLKEEELQAVHETRRRLSEDVVRLEIRDAAWKQQVAGLNAKIAGFEAMSKKMDDEFEQGVADAQMGLKTIEDEPPGLTTGEWATGFAYAEYPLMLERYEQLVAQYRRLVDLHVKTVGNLRSARRALKSLSIAAIHLFLHPWARGLQQHVRPESGGWLTKKSVGLARTLDNKIHRVLSYARWGRALADEIDRSPK